MRARCADATRGGYAEGTPSAAVSLLRHYFGSMAVNRATLVQVQSWMGHSHIQTTAHYLHAKSQADDAALLAAAFATPVAQLTAGGHTGA